MRAAEAARGHARWDGGTPAPDDIGEPAWLMAQPARDRVVETGRWRRLRGSSQASPPRSSRLAGRLRCAHCNDRNGGCATPGAVLKITRALLRLAAIILRTESALSRTLC